MNSPFTWPQRLLSNFYWEIEHVLGSRRFSDLFGSAPEKHAERLLAQLKKRGPGREIEVARIENLQPKDFSRNYHRKGVPVILSQAAKEWPCCKIWTPTYFAENYGKELSLVTDYGNDRQLPLSEAAALIMKRKMKASHFSRVVHNNKELLKHLNVGFLLSFCNFFSHKTSYQFFMGPAGAATALHAGGTNNFHIQIYGEKTWRIVDLRFNPVIRPKFTGSPLISSSFDPTHPDEQFPADRYIDVYKAKLFPGDILYIPAFYWHHVSYDTDSIASGLRWVAPTDILRAFMMYVVMATATNPSFFEYYWDIIRGNLKPFYGSRKTDQLVR